MSRARELLRDIIGAFTSYVRGQFLIALWMMVLYAAGFALLGVPLWPLLALVCGSLHVVPVAGAVLGLLFPVATALATGGSTRQVIGILGVFVFTQTFESFYLTPRILGSQLRMRPVVVFLSLTIGGLLFGFFGVLFAVPAVAIAMLIWRVLYGPPGTGGGAGSPGGPV